MQFTHSTSAYIREISIGDSGVFFAERCNSFVGDVKNNVFYYTILGGKKWAFNIYKCRYHGRLSGNAGGDVANP